MTYFLKNKLPARTISNFLFIKEGLPFLAFHCFKTRESQCHKIQYNESKGRRRLLSKILLTKMKTLKFQHSKESQYFDIGYHKYWKFIT